MSDAQYPNSKKESKSVIGRLLYSNFAGKLSHLPPFSWVARWLAYRLTTRRVDTTSIRVPEMKTRGSELQGALDGIVRDVVEILGFAGALVATFDNGEVLPVKASYFDPTLLPPEKIRDWELQATKLVGRPVSITDPNIARVYIYNKDYQKNLGVQAAHFGQNIISNELFDLFTPVTPESTRELVRGIQKALGIVQVITVPFFIESAVLDGADNTSSQTNPATRNKGEFVGNLFAAKQGIITPEDITVLSTFAQYVASFILSERRRLQVEIIEKLILDIQKSLTSEEVVLNRIVQGVVEDLGYIGAMVATYNEAEDVLPMRAIYVDTNVTTLDQIKKWEKQASDLIGMPLSLTDPNIAKVFLHDPKYKDNLSVKAAQKEMPVNSPDLFNLFTPIAPDIVREFIKGVQDGIGAHQVIAVPFFLETSQTDGKVKKELLGNLFAVSRSYKIQPWEIDTLNAFGQQAAAGLRNVTLYQKVQNLYAETQLLYKKGEDRRKAAEIFGKMAFTATASVHALRNKMSVVKGTLQIIKSVDNDNLRISALNSVDEMVTIINNLHEPGKLQNDAPVDVTSCIRRAAERTFGLDTPWIKLKLTPKLFVKTIPETLTEAFKVLIKNANEAMSIESIPEENRLLEIESIRVDDNVRITFKDHGTGIAPEDLDRIFELRYTTKESGLGFGLFWTKDYIEGLGGSMSVESQLRNGTKFIIHLPLAKD